MNASTRSITVIGAGLAGSLLAILLSRDGHRVEVFERAAEPGPVGAGFLLQPTGLQVLWQMGLLPAALAHGAPVTRLILTHHHPDHIGLAGWFAARGAELWTSRGSCSRRHASTPGPCSPTELIIPPWVPWARRAGLPSHG